MHQCSPVLTSEDVMSWYCEREYLRLGSNTQRTTPENAFQRPSIGVISGADIVQVLSGPARYSYTHGITVEDLLAPRRVSITFRQSPLRP